MTFFREKKAGRTEGRDRDRERDTERERERKRDINMREKHQSVASCMYPNWKLNLSTWSDL